MSAASDDPALRVLRAATSLRELVGDTAVAQSRRSARVRLLGLGLAFAVALPLTVAARTSSGAGGFAAVVWTCAVAAMLYSIRCSVLAGRAASAFLSPRLGYAVRPAAFNTLEGGRTHLLREREDVLSGRSRGFFSVRINKPL